MKGKTKLALAFVVLALVLGSLLVFVAPTEAQPTNGSGDTLNEKPDAGTYGACGGLEGCRSSCGCGCRGDPNACGCGG